MAYHFTLCPESCIGPFIPPLFTVVRTLSAYSNCDHRNIQSGELRCECDCRGVLLPTHPVLSKSEFCPVGYARTANIEDVAPLGTGLVVSFIQ